MNDPFVEKLKQNPELTEFQDVIEYIDEHFSYRPVAFRNGSVRNQAGQNEGSCKLFAFGQRLGLTEQQMLHCFGDYYRKDVLQNLKGSDHQNIRQFMETGWKGVVFDADPFA